MVGARIAWLVDQLDHKDYWVAVQAGLQPARFSRIMSDHVSPSWSEMVAVAAVLGCTLDWLASDAPLTELPPLCVRTPPPPDQVHRRVRGRHAKGTQQDNKESQ